MPYDGLSMQEAKKLTHGLVPLLVSLAKIEGVLDSFRDEYCRNVEIEKQDCFILALLQLIGIPASPCLNEELRTSPLYQHLLKYYQSLGDASETASPLDLFEVGAEDSHNCFRRLDHNSSLVLSSGAAQAIRPIWNYVTEFSEVRALQCAYWFGSIMNRSELSHDLRIILAVAGVRVLIQDEWLLRECSFESALYKRGGLLMNGSTDDVYRRTSERLLKAMILAVTQRVAEVETVSPRAQSESSGKMQAEIKQILQLIKDDPKTTTDKVAQYLDVSKRTAERRMGELKNQGLIRREGSSRSGHWVVNDVD